MATPSINTLLTNKYGRLKHQEFKKKLTALEVSELFNAFSRYPFLKAKGESNVETSEHTQRHIRRLKTVEGFVDMAHLLIQRHLIIQVIVFKIHQRALLELACATLHTSPYIILLRLNISFASAADTPRPS